MQECFAILVPAVPGTDAISVDQHQDQQQGSGERRRAERTLPEEDRSRSGDSGSDSGGFAAAAASNGRVGGTRNLAVDAGSGSQQRREGRDRNVPGGTVDAPEESSRTEPGASRQNEEGGQVGEEVQAAPVTETDAVAAAAAAADSDDDEGMEWEDGGGGGDGGDWESGEREDADDDADDHDDFDDGEEGEDDGAGAGGRKGKRRRWGSGAGGDGGEDSLRTIADTVEAAGLGSSGYELQVEVRGWPRGTDRQTVFWWRFFWVCFDVSMPVCVCLAEWCL